MQTTEIAVAAFALVLCSAGCGTAPSVVVPNENAGLTGTPDAGSVPPPVVIELPSARYPYTVIPVRGVAAQATAVVMDVNQAGDPIAARVNRLDQSFCQEVVLIEPADYDIGVTSQASDGRTSNSQGHLKFVYDPSAADQPSVTLCQGERPSR